MIQRRQRIVFWCLIVCIIGMGTLLVVERQRGRDRIAALADATPLDAPTAMTEAVTLDLTNDEDGTITANSRQIALPDEANARARALIEQVRFLVDGQARETLAAHADLLRTYPACDTTTSGSNSGESNP